MASFGSYGQGNRTTAQVCRDIIEQGKVEDREVRRGEHASEFKVAKLSDKAVFVLDPHSKWVGAWLPKSQIKFEGELKVGRVLNITVPGWLAREKSII